MKPSKLNERHYTPNKNAIKYYEKVVKNGDEEAKNYAKGQLEELKKK